MKSEIIYFFIFAFTRFIVDYLFLNIPETKEPILYEYSKYELFICTFFTKKSGEFCISPDSLFSANKFTGCNSALRW